jgi:uncharacterized protein involved in outer membrane biogenesis
MFRWIKIVFILILAFILTVAFFRHSLCKLLIVKLVNKATNLTLYIEDLDLDVLNSSLKMSEISLSNPVEFKNRVLGKSKQVFIKYDLPALLTGRIHLPEVKLDIDVTVIKDKRGNYNIPVLKNESKIKLRNVALIQNRLKKDEINKQPKLFIEKLNLSFVKATFMNHKAGVEQTAVIIFTLDNLELKNISDLTEAINSIAEKGGFRDFVR